MPLAPPIIVHGSIDSMDVVKDSDVSDSESALHTAKSFASQKTIVPSMLLSWHGVTASVSNKSKDGSWLPCFPSKDVEMQKRSVSSRPLLSDVFGVARPGEVVAILGPSGAGKTTLLNVLTQRNVGQLQTQGSVKINGLRVTREYMKKVAAYVQQDDLFIGSLTVEEHLRFMAKLRMGSKYKDSEQRRRVRLVMNDLGLNESAKLLIGTRTRRGISGGEKKRLAFASEILTSPPLLICDEPTSGLDAFFAFQVISILKKLAETKGMSILLTIHQPSSQVFELFSRVYILAEGRVAFCGDQAEAADLWTGLSMPPPPNFNPCDHYLATLSMSRTTNDARSRQQIAAICDAFRDSELGRATRKEACGYDCIPEDSSSSSSEEWRRRRDSASGQKFHTSFLVQLMALLWRNTMTILREPTLLKVQITQSVVIAVLTGLIYLNNQVEQRTVMNINGALFQMINNMAFMFQFSVVHHFCFEINTFYRETQSALYRVSAYFIAKNLAELPLYIVSAAIFTTIFYWMSGLVQSWESFLIYMLVGILVQNIAISIGYMFACVFGTVSVAVAVMPIFVVPMLAFGGFFINQGSLPVYFIPLKYLSYFGYAYEVLVVNEWSHVDEIPGCKKASGAGCYKDGDDVIARLSFSESNTFRNIIVMVAMIFVFRAIAFSALIVRTKSRR